MALSMNEVIMNKFFPASLSALLTLTALLPMTSTPLLAYENRDDDRYAYSGRDAYNSRRSYNGRDDDDSRESLYRPNGADQRAAWQKPNSDANSCVEGSVIGGLLGAGLGAALSRGNGRWIGVPVGGAAVVLIGCQVDGG